MTPRRRAALLALCGLSLALCASLCAPATAQSTAQSAASPGSDSPDQGHCGGVPGWPAWVRPATFQGTLGGQPVALALGRPDDDDQTRYFYTRYSTDIALTPFRSGNTLILQETVWQGPEGGLKVTGCWTLKRPASAGSTLSGVWNRPGSATRLPVRLTPLNVARLPLQHPASPGLLKLRAQDPLTFLKLNRPWVVAADGRSVREPVSGITYPQVPGAGAGLRAALQDRVLENAANALACRTQLGTSDMDEGYDLSAAITLTTRRLLSVREDVGYFCGGAHPDAYTVGLIFDRDSGRAVPPTALWPSLTPTRQKALYLAGVRPDPQSECRDVLAEMDPEFTAHLSRRGLELTPTSLPHVVAACGDTVTVSYGRLRDEANPASPYFGDFYPR